MALEIFGLVSAVVAIYVAIRFVPIMKAFSAFIDKVAENYARN